MKKKNRLWDYIFIILACVPYAVGISLFLEPNHLAAGGVSGIAIIINTLWGLPTGAMILILNIPLFIAGFFKIGRSFLFKSVYATLISSVMIDLLSVYAGPYLPVTHENITTCLAGALLQGVGIGLILKFGGSTGGTDIVVRLLRRKFRNMKAGSIYLFVDSIVILSSAVIFRNIDRAIFAAITLTICSAVVDFVLYGKDGAKQLIIISQKPEIVAGRLMEDIGAGVTFVTGQGAYTGSEKKVIICAVKNHHLPKVKDILKEEDDRSFMIVSSATEILGEGYKKHGVEEI